MGSVFETFNDINKITHNKKACLVNGQAVVFVAGVTRLELAIFPSRLTGRSNQFLNVRFAFSRFDLLFPLCCTGSVRVFLSIHYRPRLLGFCICRSSLVVAFKSIGEVLGGADVIGSVFETFNDINKITHNKKACLVNGQAVVFYGGSDETRTRDLPVMIDGTL